MADITHTIRLARGQTVDLNEAELIELRDALNRLYPPPPPPSVLAPLVAPLPHPPSPVWPPLTVPTYVGDVIPNPFEVTCGPAA